MEVLALDLETFRFAPGLMAPRPVCCSYAGKDGSGLVHMAVPGSWDIVRKLIAHAGEGDLVLAGHHVCYDLGCLCAWADDPLDWLKKVFAAYDAQGIEDTEIREKLLDIADGRLRGYEDDGGRWIKHAYHLADVSERRTGHRPPKPQEIRTGYGDLWEKPIEEWPTEAVRYAVHDSECTLAVRQAQEKARETPDGDALEDQHRQAAKSWALHLAGAWGLRTDRAGVEALEAKAREEIAVLGETLKAAQLLRPNGSRDTKKAAEIMREAWPDGPTTETGRTCIDEQACRESKDPRLLAWADYAKQQNMLSRKVPALMGGVDAPIHTYFDSLVASGRTSSSAPNVQNIDRTHGLRECFVPRPGHLLCAADFGKAELHGLAQVCYEVVGWSKLGDALNAKKDPHLILAAGFLGATYEEAEECRKDPTVKDARQKAKAINFGVPGGLGAASLRAYAKQSYGVDLTEDQAVAWRERYLDTFLEMREYFAHVNRLLGDEGTARIRQLYSNRLRGGCRYTVLCNTLFQGLCADFSAAALFAVAKKEYAAPGNPLYGCRTINFIHDELLIEVPEDPDLADAAARELASTMAEAAREWTPRCPVSADAVLMRRWSKEAEPVVRDGKLVVWEPAP